MKTTEMVSPSGRPVDPCIYISRKTGNPWMVSIPGIKRKLRFEDLYPGCDDPSGAYHLDPLLSEDQRLRAQHAARAYQEWESRGFPCVEDCEDIPFLCLLGPALRRDPFLDDPGRFIVSETPVGHEAENHAALGVGDGMGNVRNQVFIHMFTPPFLMNLNS